MEAYILFNILHFFVTNNTNKTKRKNKCSLEFLSCINRKCLIYLYDFCYSICEDDMTLQTIFFMFVKEVSYALAHQRCIYLI